MATFKNRTRFPVDKSIDFLRDNGKALIVLGVALFIFAGVTIQYFAEQGKPCSACHATRQQTNTWKTSAHRYVSCLACHQEPGYLSLVRLQLQTTRNFTAWLFGTYREPIVTSVKNESCLSCHDREIKDTIVSKGIRVSHKEFSSYLCTSCHANAAHDMPNRIRNYPDMDSCAGCHNYSQGDVTCEKCHPKNARAEDLNSRGPWKVTHGPNWRDTHGMGDPKTCATCHDERFCMMCHKSEVPHTEPWSYLHGKAAKYNVEGCYQCHKKNLCSDCHRMEMPHPPSFISQHQATVKKRGYDVCWRCHEEEGCQACHLRGAHPNTPNKKFAPHGGTR